jgi:hypothetical protein
MRMVTLAEMLQFDAGKFLRLSGLISTIAQTMAAAESHGGPMDDRVHGEVAASIKNGIANIREDSESLGLELVVAQVDRICRYLDSEQATFPRLSRFVDELETRIVDSFDREAFFHLTRSEVALFDSHHPFGPAVSNAFPSSIIDVEEAAKCLALARPTACVLHLMRAMEFVLEAVAKSINVDYQFQGWEAIIKRMRSEMDKDYKSMAPQFAGRKEFLSSVLDRLMTVKDALRNPTMHARVHYDLDRADEVYRASRVFMQKVAEEIAESQPATV